MSYKQLRSLDGEDSDRVVVEVLYVFVYGQWLA